MTTSTPVLQIVHPELTKPVWARLEKSEDHLFLVDVATGIWATGHTEEEVVADFVQVLDGYRQVLAQQDALSFRLRHHLKYLQEHLAQ